MKRVGITGHNGFVGYHLYNTLKLYTDEFVLVQFDRSFFGDESNLDSFISQCDVIIHLAALNRHNDPDVLYSVNIDLVDKLVKSLERTKSKAHLIISSSTQEERENLYGKSKKDGRLKISDWANRSGTMFTGLIIPNVYGPFGNPYYNSVVATFCHQVSRNEMPKIEIDNQLKLIYVGELVEEVIKIIRNEVNNHELQIPHTAEAKVSEVLALLNYYKDVYQENGEFPAINNSFEHNLFNTYRSYIDFTNYFPRKFKLHKDNRGAFVEIARHGIAGQTSFSTTVSGITRGNHYHTRKIERFAVIKGKALIQFRQVGKNQKFEFFLDGDEPSYVDMPVWFTHNIKNIGDDLLYTVFWINEPYDPFDPDTYIEIV